MTDLPRASVILPTYNRAYCLPAVIDSVLGQSFQDFEIVVVDDGSSDATAAVIADRYAREPRVRYFQRPNGGVSAARNSAMKLARGEVLVFCDSDDLWLEHKLQVQMATFDRFPQVNLLWSDVTAVDVSGRILHERYTRVCYPAWQTRPIDELFAQSDTVGAVCPRLPPEWGDARVYAGDIFPTMLQGTLINMPSVAVRSSLVAGIGAFDETMRTGEDYDFNLRACAAGPVAFIDRPTVLYRTGAGDQLTRPSLFVDQARNWFRTTRRFLEGGRLPQGLSARQLRAVLAGKYHWLGMSELDCGDRRAARAALWASIWYGNRSSRLWLNLFSTFLPPAFEGFARDAYRRVKRA